LIDRAHIGRELPPHTVPVEASRLRLFAKATGEDRPEYVDDQAAKEAGFPGLPAPPTFLFALENEVPDNMAWLVELNMDIGRVLHGEQSFTYKRQVFAGDVLTFRPRISEIYDKKGGALEFILRTTDVIDQVGEPVAELRMLAVQRNG
jgi:acyl dehydratase